MQEDQDSNLMVLRRETGDDGAPRLVLSGRCTLTSLGGRMRSLSAELAGYAADPALQWDITEIAQMDDAGAVLLWRAWGERRPEHLLLRPEQERLLDRLQTPPRPPPPPERLAVAHQVSRQGCFFAMGTSGQFADFVRPIAVGCAVSGRAPAAYSMAGDLR